MSRLKGITNETIWIESPVLANQDGTFFVLHYHVRFPHFCTKLIDKQTYYDYE